MPKKKTIDELGEILHEIKVLTERADALKTELRIESDGKYATDNYVATISTRRSTFDAKAFEREYDPESWPTYWTTKQVPNMPEIQKTLAPDQVDDFYAFSVVVSVKEVTE